MELRAESVGRWPRPCRWAFVMPGLNGWLAVLTRDRFITATRSNSSFAAKKPLRHVRQAIEGATEEILLETYILRDDATGRKLLGLLGAAAARGVKVRVLADAYGSWTTKRRVLAGDAATWGLRRGCFARCGVICGVFFRDHRKIIAIDRRISFTGGMNVANEYGSSRHNQERFVAGYSCARRGADCLGNGPRLR